METFDFAEESKEKLFDIHQNARYVQWTLMQFDIPSTTKPGTKLIRAQELKHIFHVLIHYYREIGFDSASITIAYHLNS